MTEQFEQVVAAGPQSSHPPSKELTSDRETLLGEITNHIHERGRGSLHHLGDTFHHDIHSGLFAGQSIERKDAFTGLAGLTTSQSDL